MRATGVVVVFSLTVMVIVLHVNAKKNKEVPKPYWSKWGPWSESCTVTCGLGVRRRKRTCIVPQDTTMKKKKVLKVMKVHTNVRCPGRVVSQAKNCDTGLTCPIHGGWTPWETLDCTVTCGGGRGKRRRSCTNPKPMFKGQECEGSSVEVGGCNEHACPDQIHTLPPSTAKLVDDQIHGMHLNLQKKQGASLRIPCREDVVSAIYRYYPLSKVYWTRNGDVMRTDNVRVKMAPYDLTMKSLDVSDNGVYVCHISYGPGVDKPISVAAVTVWGPNPDLVVHDGENFNLTCHGQGLSVAYQNLSQKWYHNDAVFLDFADTSLSTWNTYSVGPASRNMTGFWSCQVTDRVTGKIWVTNAVRLKVLPPVQLHHKILSNKNVWIVVAISMCLLVLIVCSYLSYAISKEREESKVAFETWCLVAELERVNNGTFRSWYPDGEHLNLLESEDLASSEHLESDL